MMWIGLTGSIGSGKSTVALILKKLGYYVVNADAIAHEGLKSGSASFDAIRDRFGPQILTSDGEVDRRKLGQLVFSNPIHKSWLEGLLHPMVQTKVQALRKQLEFEGHLLAFYEVPLLFEKKLESQFDKVIVVWVSDSVQRERLKKRNAWTEEEITQRNQAQWPIEDKLKRADYSINNDGSVEDLEGQIESILKRLKN